jgi:probable HAF family extracellular repeat protein
MSRAYGINDEGQVVGMSYLLGGNPHAFLWEDGTMTDLGTLGGYGSEARDINDAGQIVGMASTPSISNRAFLWQNGAMQDLGTLGGNGSDAFGINSSGQVVGFSGMPIGPSHAFLWQNGSMQDLGTFGLNATAYGINDSGQVVGDSCYPTVHPCHAFLWQGGSLQDLGHLGGETSRAYAINEAGQVVGESHTGNGEIHPFLWQNGAMQDLGTLSGPGSNDSHAFDINDDGQVVGASAYHAFLWENGQMQDLNNLIPANSGWVLYVARAINNKDQIVGYGGINGQTHAFLLKPLPAWTLMFYLDGDNTLSPTYLAIIQQLQRAATNPNVNIVALWDSSGGSDSAYYKFRANGMDITAQGELDMSNPTTLVNFANWARTNYPARHYALLLDNHGSGVTGGLVDDTTSPSAIMRVPQMGAALNTITVNGANKIDVLVMNMCLMGMIEDAYEMGNYIDYYVASENLQWSYSNGYYTYVSGVISTTTPSQFATAVVNGYANDVSSKSYTMSAADISQLGNLVNATNSLALLLTSNITTTAPILTNISQAVQRYDNKAPSGIDTADQYIDLYDFARLVKAGVADAGIQNAAQGVMDAVNGYIIAERHHSFLGGWFGIYDLDDSHGVSIFFPSMKGSFYTGLNLSFAAGTSWGGFSLQQASDATNAWGPMLVSYFEATQPGGADEPNLPEPVSKLVEHRLYLPLVVR